MEPDEMQLAISYADLSTSLAFQDFIRFQNAECERLELAALNAPDGEAKSAIIAWQQRRLVIRTFQEAVRDSVTAVRSIEMENQDARPDRSNW